MQHTVLGLLSLCRMFPAGAHSNALSPCMQVLHTLCWDSGESLRLAALSLPAPTLALLVQRLQAAELSLTAGEGPPAWLHQLQSLTRLYMNWPTSSSQQPALRVPLPPSVVWAYLAEEGYAAQPRPRPLVMDLRLCPAALQYLAVQGFLSARLECSDPLAVLQSLTVKLNPWARGPANVLQFAAAAQRPCPALEYLLLGLVTGAIDLHQFPSLKELELVSSPAKLSARQQLPHLTRLTAEGLWSTPTQSPALAHMSALQELAIRYVDEARIDIGCFPCLTALELDGVSSLQLMASGSRVVPGITRLECCATSVSDKFSALPALRELELPLADEQDMESVLADLPALTALTCSASAHIPKSACWELQHLCLCYGLSEVEEDKYGDEFESAGEKVADLGDDPIFISKVGICTRHRALCCARCIMPASLDSISHINGRLGTWAALHPIHPTKTRPHQPPNTNPSLPGRACGLLQSSHPSHSWMPGCTTRLP